MSDETKTIPMVTPTKPADTCSTGCGSCHSAGCTGSLGIVAGSEKNIVYRNVFIYTTMGVVMVVVTFILMKVLTAIFG